MKRPVIGRDRGFEIRHKWLIKLAILAAPNPLSMFTTATPDEQLLSIPRNAAIPPKLAPYPILVGTAMTGTQTRPDTTLGKAPSIPATTMMTRAAASLACSASTR